MIPSGQLPGLRLNIPPRLSYGMATRRAPIQTTFRRRNMFTKALVPLDNTEISEGIIPLVTQIAQGLDMEVVLATAINPDHSPGTLFDRIRGGGGGPPSPTAEAISGPSDENAERDARSRLDRLVSVAEAVVRESGEPVLMIRSQATATPGSARVPTPGPTPA